MFPRQYVRKKQRNCLNTCPKVLFAPVSSYNIKNAWRDRYMEELYKQGKGIHKLTLTNRGALTLNGVVDVISFDLNEVLLETESGMLTVKGQDLHVNHLTLEKGEVEISGNVDSLLYSDVSSYGQKAESFFGRLFQ